MTGIEHAFYKEHNARTCLQAEESNARKRTYEAEEQATIKRLKKTDEKITWDLKDLCRSRGMDEEEIELLLAQRPNRGSFLLGETDG